MEFASFEQRHDAEVAKGAKAACHALSELEQAVDGFNHAVGAARKADARQDKLLAGLVGTRGDDTLAKHAASLAALPGGTRLSEATICRALGRLRLTQKKETLFPDERECERVQALRAAHQAESRFPKHLGRVGATRTTTCFQPVSLWRGGHVNRTSLIPSGLSDRSTAPRQGGNKSLCE